MKCILRISTVKKLSGKGGRLEVNQVNLFEMTEPLQVMKEGVKAFKSLSKESREANVLCSSYNYEYRNGEKVHKIRTVLDPIGETTTIYDYELIGLDL